MEDKKNLNEKSNVIDFELALLQAQEERLQKELDALALEDQLRQEFEDQFYTVLSRRLGYHVDKYTIRTANVPDTTWGEAVDEVMKRENDLIRPSHEYLPYSLTKAKPEIKEYLPGKSLATALQMLNEKSTSRAFEIIKEYTSENTHLAHMGDLIYWQAWLSAIGFSFQEPITEKDIMTFIVQHAEGIDHTIDEKLVKQGFKLKLGAHKLSTIKRRIGSLSVFLECAKWPNPCRNKEITVLLQKLTKKYGGSKPAGKAITKDILNDMLETCEDKLIDIRDKALLLFAWASGGRRRAEVTAADIKDLTRTPTDEFVYNIPKSKTDQEGHGYPVPVNGRAAQALNQWLSASHITEGKIFRSVRKSNEIGGNLSPLDVHRIVRRRLKKAGYDETQFGAHSLRSGFVTEAGRKGKHLGDVMQLTTHKNVGTVMKYYQAGSVTNNSASNLAD